MISIKELCRNVYLNNYNVINFVDDYIKKDVKKKKKIVERTVEKSVLDELA